MAVWEGGIDLAKKKRKSPKKKVPHKYDTDAKVESFEYSDKDVRTPLYAEMPHPSSPAFHQQKRWFRKFQDCPPNHPWSEGYASGKRAKNLYPFYEVYNHYMWEAGKAQRWIIEEDRLT